MGRKTNFIFNALTLLITVALVFVSAFITSRHYYVENIFDTVPYYIIGAVVGGIINAFLHELGHVIAGKKNGFKFISMTVWFFKWEKLGKRTGFKFVMLSESAGATEMLPNGNENLAKRFKSMSFGGIFASLILTVISIPPLFLGKYLGMEIFCVLSMFLPLSAYYLFGTALPVSSYGVRNDGAVIRGISKNDDVSKVTINLLAIHGELYAGKTPAEIDENLYFDLPQLPEDDINFTLLLNARYNYYLDKEDYENAQKASDRLMGIIDDIPKSVRPVIQADALYNACTFDFNEETADDLMYELEKYLNKDNGATNVRIKMAYLAFIRHETEVIDIFYKKGKKEAKNHRIKGLGRFEDKLLDDVYGKTPRLLEEEKTAE